MTKSTYLFILLGCLSMFSCKSDDADAIENQFPVFTEQDMDLVHGTDSLTWVLTELNVQEEYSPTLEPLCLEDDLFTIYPGQQDANVTLGELDCGDDELILAGLGLDIYFDSSSVDPCCESAIKARLIFDYNNLSGNGGPLVLLQAYYLLEANADRLIFVLSAGDNVIIEDYRDYEYYFVLERVN